MRHDNSGPGVEAALRRMEADRREQRRRLVELRSAFVAGVIVGVIIANVIPYIL